MGVGGTNVCPRLTVSLCLHVRIGGNVWVDWCPYRCLHLAISLTKNITDLGLYSGTFEYCASWDQTFCPL